MNSIRQGEITKARRTVNSRIVILKHGITYDGILFRVNDPHKFEKYFIDMKVFGNISDQEIYKLYLERNV